jgi:hypothetical protein
MFLVYSWGILGYIVSNEGKLPYPNKILAIKDMPPQKKSTRHWSVQWSGVVLPMLHQESYIHNGTNHKTHVWSENIWMDAWMLNHMGDKKLLCGCTNFDCISLGFWIPCYIEASNSVEGTMLTQNIVNKYNQLIVFQLFNNVKQN